MISFFAKINTTVADLRENPRNAILFSFTKISKVHCF